LHLSKDTELQVLAFSSVLCLSIFSPVVLVALWPFPEGIYLAWDWANFMGYMSLAICGFLFVYRGRARAFPAFSGRFFANLHRELGYIALLLLFLHAGILLVSEPLLVEHLKPTAPLHMLAGIIALLLMVVLVISAIPYVRRRLWHDYHVFRHIHAVLAVCISGLVAYHVLSSGFYLNGVWKVGLASTLTFVILVSYVFGSQSVGTETEPNSSGTTPGKKSNSSRYSRVISYGCTTLLVLASFLLALGLQTE
jgi:DMSO/TMAO reductase YedYZ heme-binding membrane subunit